MTASAARERSSSGGLLSIGQVLARLEGEFPGLSSSKLRFLEAQGIVTPSRTESGYRKFSPNDVERVRLALTLQRDHYMPHAVIRDHLADIDAGNSPDVPVPSIHSTTRRYKRADLLAAAGASPQLLNDAISTGVIVAAENYTEDTVSLLRALVALDRHGIEPRHVRGMRQAAEREASLIESALSSYLRRKDASARARADELAPELAKRLDDVRRIFVQNAIERMLAP